MAKSQKQQRRGRDETMKKQKKAKKEKKKHSQHKHKHKHKHKQSSSSSHTHKRSSSNQSSSKNDDPTQKKPVIDAGGFQLSEAKPLTITQHIRKNKINVNLLTNIISDHKKINRKLDAEQTSRAASKFKQNFTEEIKPITMSAYLSNEALQKKVSSKQLKGLMQCSICEVTFQEGRDLEEHMLTHNQ